MGCCPFKEFEADVPKGHLDVGETWDICWCRIIAQGRNFAISRRNLYFLFR